MSLIPITLRNTNLEILSKLLNSVAKKYGCHVVYIADDNRLKFIGDQECCRHISEEVLTFFSKSIGASELPLNCPIEKNRNVD